MTKILHKPSPLNDIVKDSILICKGSPAQYCLTTTRSNLVEDGMVRKWTFGQQDTTKPNKTLLMVGETGTGKTALINAMVNYALGVRYNHNLWFKITDETEDAQTHDQTSSQTLKTTFYEIFGHNMPFSLTVIDTPGFGDTRKAEYDEEIGDNLHKLFLHDTGVKEIDAVCLVVKASMNRLSERQRYIFDAVLSLFGKDVENNIVVCVTHSDGGPPTNAINAIEKAKIPCRKDNENQPVCFLFNNRQTEARGPEYSDFYQRVWDQTEKNLGAFFTSLEHHNKISIVKTQDVLLKRIQLKAYISNLYDRIEFTEKKQEELTQIQDIFHKNEEKIQNDENFTFVITRSRKEKVKIDAWWFNKATTCSVCEENCHLPCTLGWSASWCKVMEKGKCTVCTSKCPVEKHVTEDKKFIIKTGMETVTYEKLKEELQRNDKSEQLSYNKLIFGILQMREATRNIADLLEIQIFINEKKMAGLLEEACNTIMSLCEIALKPDSVFIMESLDFLISRMKKTGNHVLVKKLEDLRKTEPEAENVIHSVRRFRTAKLAIFKMTGDRKRVLN